MKGRRLWLIVAVVLSVVVQSRGAEAQQTQCFSVDGGDRGARGRVQHVVGLASEVRLSDRCSYALSAQGPWSSASALVGRSTDFLELMRLLTGSDEHPEGSGDPRFIFGRPNGSTSATAAQGDLQSLILRYCSHYLLEEQLGFRVIPNGTEGGVRIVRVRGAEQQQCSADQLELRIEEGAASRLLSSTPRGSTRRLEISGDEVVLPRGEWAVYAARPRGRVGLRVGVFRARGVSTPLQNYLRTLGLGERGPSAPSPLLVAHWEPERDGVRLTPTEQASSDGILWAELRTAADAGLLWLARAPRGRGEGSDAPVVVQDVVLEAGRPQALRFPDRPVQEHMLERYGEAGAALTPNFQDWGAIFRDLALCLTPSYLEQQDGRPGVAAPDPGSCAAFRSVIEIEPSGGGAGGSGARVCLRRGMQIIGAEGARWGATSEEPVCFPLPRGDEPMPRQMAVVGDSLTVENGAGLCLLIDNQRIEPEGGVYHLRRSGLLEVRQGGGVDCASTQALSRLRLPVLDPEREWHPVGLHTDEEEALCSSEEGESGATDEGGRCPWRGLDHDEDEVFAYVRSRHSLAFRISTSPAVAAVINRDPEAAVLLGRDVPLLSGVSGDFEGPEAPAVFAFVSRSAQCPSGEGASVAELRRQRPLEPDGEIVDRIFHVFLATAESEDEPPRCLARTTFRVRHSRSLVNATAGRMIGVELGLLGDTQAIFYFTQPLAMGVALPVFYFRLNLFPIRSFRWLALEVAGDLTFGAAFDPVGVSRAGAALSIALQLGVPKWVPRLLSVGMMIHGAWESLPEEGDEDNNPIVSGYIGLDLSTLVDLAGGR